MKNLTKRVFLLFPLPAHTFNAGYFILSYRMDFGLLSADWFYQSEELASLKEATFAFCAVFRLVKPIRRIGWLCIALFRIGSALLILKKPTAMHRKEPKQSNVIYNYISLIMLLIKCAHFLIGRDFYTTQNFFMSFF